MPNSKWVGWVKQTVNLNWFTLSQLISYFNHLNSIFILLYYEDGSRYEGEWKDGNRHGKGVFYTKISIEIFYFELKYELGSLCKPAALHTKTKYLNEYWIKIEF